MIGSQFSVLHGGADASRSMSPGRTVDTGPSQADVQFWQDVFDSAKGIGVDASATLMADAASDASAHPSSSPLAANQQANVRMATSTPASMPFVQGGSSALAPYGQPDVRLAKPALLMGGRMLASIEAAAAYGSGDDTVSVSLDRAAKVSVDVAYDDTGVEASLKAHVVQTPDGDWKVTLRTNKKLSVAQALSAVAEALKRDGMPQGQIDQVVLNGTCIYQQNNQTGASASANFEWQC